MSRVRDLFTPADSPATLKKRFIGKRARLEDVLGVGIEIVDFEIGKSDRTGRDLLYLQVKLYGQPRLVWSEGCLLIKTIKSVNRAELPFSTIVTRDTRGYLRFEKTK